MKALVELAGRYADNEAVLKNAVFGFTDDDWFRIPATGGNQAFWILGHLVTSRRELVRGCGTRLSVEPWEALFARGTNGETRDFGDVVLLLEDFVVSGQRIQTCVEKVVDAAEELAFPLALPDGSTTVKDAVHYLYFHEIYHLGQLGLRSRVRAQTEDG